MAKIEFWLEYASTYSYLIVARIGKLAGEYGVQIDWQPGWCREFSEAAFHLHWTKGILMGTPENLAAALASAGQDVARVEALASSPEIKDGLKQQTTRALQRGIFGAPSFLVNGELFWGDDRLEAALDCARSLARG